MKMTGNAMLITGGGSGLGREWARRFHALGNKVIVAGRRMDALEATAEGYPGMECLTFDATDAASTRALAAEAIAAYPGLNVVMHNAGVMMAENLTAPDLDKSTAMIATNLTAPIELTAALMPHLLHVPDATIITVSSGLAFVPLAITPTYNATKAAIHSWSLSLRHQLKDHGIEVIEIAPPGVATDLMPGQADNPAMMPLDDFIDETMALMARQPALDEICVQRVGFLRNAERENRFDDTFKMLNGGH